MYTVVFMPVVSNQTCLIKELKDVVFLGPVVKETNY